MHQSADAHLFAALGISPGFLLMSSSAFHTGVISAIRGFDAFLNLYGLSRSRDSCLIDGDCDVLACLSRGNREVFNVGVVGCQGRLHPRSSEVAFLDVGGDFGRQKASNSCRVVAESRQDGAG